MKIKLSSVKIMHTYFNIALYNIQIINLKKFNFVPINMLCVTMWHNVNKIDFYPKLYDSYNKHLKILHQSLHYDQMYSALNHFFSTTITNCKLL
jgi:hypothetical protein